ncbi:MULTISPECIES: hypothetical protein [unclassified Methylotenera]|jgi:hypothetical protein|uniref:hypothetical protein n=1 Tax=unclassified Methylotenera TaxID=2643294 RepID=UPI000377BF79|nr:MULTISPECIES: hypothetical protein [unclassified Methylotenera]
MKVKNVVLMLMLSMISGCGTTGSAIKNMVNNTDQSGIVYGSSVIDATVSDEFVDIYGVKINPLESICKKVIDNKDPRCTHIEDYVLVTTWTKFSYEDGGATGINSLVKKDFPNLDKLRYVGFMHDKNVPFVKAQVIPGQLGEVLEIVSVDGDGKCYWLDYKRVGGAVCPTYNYDYRKNFTGIAFSH